MLTFAHIPTGTATNNEFDIDEMNSRRLKSAVASAIGADIKPAGLHLRKRLRLSHVRGPSQTIGLHPALGAPIRAVRETVCYVTLLRRLVLRRLLQQQQSCHNHMISVSEDIRRRTSR
jgi:hypothetical protein